MVCQADQVPPVRVRAATSSAACGRATPEPQLRPTSPKPVTGWGVVVRRLPPPGCATTRAAEVTAALRPAVRPAGGAAVVSWTSRTIGFTGAVGTFEARIASAV